MQTLIDKAIQLPEEGNKTFAIINTANYDLDSLGVIVVEVENANQLEDYGYRPSEIKVAETLEVGDKFDSFDYGDGCILVRMA